MGKVGHVVPSRGAAWDMAVQAGELMTGRDPALYYKHAKSFFERARKASKPFFLMANSHDPHRPFAGSDQERSRRAAKKRFPPVVNPFEPAKVPVPGFLPPLPQVRREIAEYFTSARRADQTVGAVLRALDDSGLAGRTLVMVMSDNGMALPFAKTNCYMHSTRTPWIVRWPGKVRAGAVDDRHFVSGIDLMPTVLDALGLPPVKGVDGRSFLPLLRGGTQAGRERVFTHFHRTAGKKDYPMRAVQDRRFGYIFNGWADGKTVFRNESQSGRTMKAMRKAAETDAGVAARVRHFLNRTPEELYDYEHDPDALRNMAGDPKYRSQVEEYRRLLLEHMKATGDPLADTYTSFLAKRK